MCQWRGYEMLERLYYVYRIFLCFFAGQQLPVCGWSYRSSGHREMEPSPPNSTTGTDHRRRYPEMVTRLFFYRWPILNNELKVHTRTILCTLQQPALRATKLVSALKLTFSLRGNRSTMNGGTPYSLGDHIG